MPYQELSCCGVGLPLPGDAQQQHSGLHPPDARSTPSKHDNKNASRGDDMRWGPKPGVGTWDLEPCQKLPPQAFAGSSPILKLRQIIQNNIMLCNKCEGEHFKKKEPSQRSHHVFNDAHQATGRRPVLTWLRTQEFTVSVAPT